MDLISRNRCLEPMMTSKGHGQSEYSSLGSVCVSVGYMDVDMDVDVDTVM